MQIIISGSMAYDRIMNFPESFAKYLIEGKLDEINVCFMVDGMQENFGGTAGNIAYALKLLGGTPLISATIGLDYQRYFDWLEKNAISTESILLVENEWTAGAYITTDTNNNQITTFNPGAMNYSSKLDITALHKDDLLIVSPGNIGDMVTYPQQCQEKNIRYIFDPGQALPALQGEDLLNSIDGCWMLMVNDYEMELIVQKTAQARENIINRAGNCVITRGDQGSTLYEGKTTTTIPAAKASRVLDPTGAGDAYRGGLLYGISRGESLPASCYIGSVCASFAVACNGTQKFTFDSAEFEARLQSIK